MILKDTESKNANLLRLTCLTVALAVSLAGLSGLTGCATTAADKKLTALEKQNRLLLKQLGALKRQQPQVQVSSGRRLPMAAFGPTLLPPAQLAHRTAGLPKTWAFLHRDPIACQNSPLHYVIWNHTGYHLTLMLDGQPVRIWGGTGALPTIPPGKSARMCMDEIGLHSLNGQALTARYPHLVKVGTFDKDVYIGTNRLGYVEYIRDCDVR